MSAVDTNRWRYDIAQVETLHREASVSPELPEVAQTVEISETDLSKAPESLLSVAAQQPHEGSIAVPKWPGASLQILQVL